ncbi:MAG: ATP-dependent Clp protease ATP-binding subunit [Candidatus Kerfeldbacteria bacterium]|nr:ATP-dependent Clp protease ATP-binding subunit [Candidatus Kerfeldbacteria bacterium]
MQEVFQSDIEFIPCLVCKGFGYTVTPAQHHVTCAQCRGKRALYAIMRSRAFAWDLPMSPRHVSQRRMQRVLNLALHIILGCIGLIGIALCIYTVVVGHFRYESVVGLFTQPNPIIGFFWLSLLVDGLLYYRLERTIFLGRRIPEEYARMDELPSHRTHEVLKDLQSSAIYDISTFFTPDALEVIDHAYHLAKKLHHHQITPLHILAGIFEEGKLAATFVRLGLAPKVVMEQIARAMQAEHVQTGAGLNLSVDSVKLFFYAFETALLDKQRAVDVAELFIAIVEHDAWSSRIFDELEINDNTVRQAIEWIRIAEHLRERFALWEKKSSHKPKGIMNRSMTARPSPLLQSLSSDYTARAVRGAFFPLIGRIDEMEQVMRILQEPHGNVLCVGPSGAGKTSMFEGVAELMAAEDVPESLQDKRFVVLDPGALLSHAEGLGAVESRMLEVIQEIEDAGNIILGIEDIHHLINMRSTGGSEDVASILMNALSEGRLHIVATSTTAEYQQLIESHAPFLRRFQLVHINEMSESEAIQVCEARALIEESKHHVFFTYRAIASAVEWSKKYIHDRYLPAKAIDVISETALYVAEKKGEKSLVTHEDIAYVISQKTGIPVTSLTEDERQKLLHLEEMLHEYVVGQDAAVKACAESVRRAREGLREANRPIANLLFVGPSGVGKTELAKALASVYFGENHGIIRFDMTEYQDPFSVRKLIGGKGETGLLTERVRMQPYGLILLDELEKAHPDVLNVFLQIMDDGRVTDGQGSTCDFTNCMIIATSNAANQNIYNAYNAGMASEDIHEWLMEKVLPQSFRSELLNRFDQVVACTPLSKEVVHEIARRMIAKTAQRLKADKGINLEVSAEAISELAEKGYHPMYGARPLRRLLQDTIDSGLARILLQGNIGRRDTLVLEAGGVMRVVHE